MPNKCLSIEEQKKFHLSRVKALREERRRIICQQMNQTRSFIVYTKLSSSKPLIPQTHSKGFTRAHLFDVYLDDKSTKKERLPPIVNLYNQANKLRLIEQYNPTTLRSFNELEKTFCQIKKPYPTAFDSSSQTLFFGGIKVKKTSEIYK